MSSDSSQPPARTASPSAAPRASATPRGPGSLADWIPRVLAEMGLDAANDGAKLLAAWARAVGPELAPHSRAQGIRRGVVHATVSDSAWMQRFQMEKMRVLERLRSELGAEVVRDLRLRIAPPT